MTFYIGLYLKLHVLLSKFLWPIILSYRKNAFGKSKNKLANLAGFADQR